MASSLVKIAICMIDCMHSKPNILGKFEVECTHVAAIGLLRDFLRVSQ